MMTFPEDYEIRITKEGKYEMSEKLSELTNQYSCDLCATTQCLSPIKKGFTKEGKNNEGDMIVLDYDAWFCCRDNNSISYCIFCETISTKVEKKVDVPTIKEEVVKESTVIKKVVDEVKALPKKMKTDLQKRKEAILKQLEELRKEEENPQ
ncbi:hypothetical protein LCGC14_0547590 [marine sediment metagenome]|uniref:Uncharacterized protein n=1 Tax=marine sediment metagenome TaxID=412755 RepID=A0A0F9S9D0_9ZZZZ